MPAYNCDKYIHKAISSILFQTEGNFELLITDDGSTDKTIKIINSFTDKRIVLRKNKKNIGNLRTINKLLKSCKGKYIALQDADDWSSKNRLSIQLETLENNPSIDLCGTNCIKFYSQNIQITSNYPLSSTELIKSIEQGRTSLFCGASVLFRRTALLSIGTYQECFDRIGSADIDWHLRLLEKHLAINIEEPLYYYRQLQNSYSNSGNESSIKRNSTNIAYALHLLRKSGQRETSTLKQETFRIAVTEKTEGAHPSTIDKVVMELFNLAANSKTNNKVAAFIFKLALSTLQTATVQHYINTKRRKSAEKIKHKLIIK